MRDYFLSVFMMIFVMSFVTVTYGQAKVVVIPLFGEEGASVANPDSCEDGDSVRWSTALNGLVCGGTYNVGDIGPAGGIVFLTTAGGLHGLEAATEDQISASWNCDGTDVSNVFN